MYSITAQSSFTSLGALWLREMRQHTPATCVACVVGNKSDLACLRSVPAEKGRRLAQEWGCAFAEASALSGEHVSDLFVQLAEGMRRWLGKSGE